MEWGRESVLKVLVLSRVVSSWCTSTHEASRDLRQIRVYWEKSLQNCEQLMPLHPQGPSWAKSVRFYWRKAEKWRIQVAGHWSGAGGPASNYWFTSSGFRIYEPEAMKWTKLILVQEQMRGKQAVSYLYLTGSEVTVPDSANRLLCVKVGNGFVHLGAGAQEI